MNKMIEEISNIHKADICLYKVGTFYHIYGKDAYIMSYLFGYKIKDLGEQHKECGFPITTINKITAKLQSLPINYLLIDRRNNYEVDEKEDYDKNNKYDKIYDKAKKYVNCKRRADNISQFLTENLEKEDITKILARMEEIMYEA